MLNRNTQATTLFVLYIATLGSSWRLFLLDGNQIPQNSTRTKRQNTGYGQSCTLPVHPPNGKYTLSGSSQYTPGSTANEFSNIQLTCNNPYTTKSSNPQALCIEGLWSPPLSAIEECVGPPPTTTPATTTTISKPSTSSLGNSCYLPSHLAKGLFSVAGSSEPYVPNATAAEFSSIRLSCFDGYATQINNPQSLCIEGAWSPPIFILGKCIRRSTQLDVSTEDECFLPRHPPNGEYRSSQNKIYSSDTSVPHLSSLDLTCKYTHVTEKNLPRALCNKGEWFPPISELGGCVRKDAVSSTTTQAPKLEGSCALPDHPANGRFQMLGSKNYNYKPNSIVHEFATLQLTCAGEDVPQNSICSRGEWLPAVSCTGFRIPTPGLRSRHGCVLPSKQTHGDYEQSSDKKFDVIFLVCNNGYYPKHESHLCSNGTWYPPLFDCIRTCPPLKKSETYNATCVRGSSTINCDEALEGTEVLIRCSNFFEYKERRAITKCEGGAWTKTIPPCVPECGKRRVPVKTNVIGGKFSVQGEYPWLVGIYVKANSSHICGGSIISRYFVLSAAHCFATYNDALRALDPVDVTQYLVAAGKYYRTLYDEKDKHKQITGVNRIYISEYYSGNVQNFRYDYAILKVEVPFTLSQYVQLVCVDWELKYETRDFKENNTAVVLGWGYTKQGTEPSEELKKLQIYLKWRSSCNEYLPPEFSQRYYIEDKMCAGFIGQNVCSGDSGGGLYFEHDFVYYVRGIVSLSPHSKVGCSVSHYALYTNVSTYINNIIHETGLNL